MLEEKYNGGVVSAFFLRRLNSTPSLGLPVSHLLAPWLLGSLAPWLLGSLAPLSECPFITSNPANRLFFLERTFKCLVRARRDKTAFLRVNPGLNGTQRTAFGMILAPQGL